MSLALIVIILFLAAGFFQKSIIRKRAAKRNGVAKTNLELQMKIGVAIKEIISADIERLILSGLSRLDASRRLLTLFKRFRLMRLLKSDMTK